MGNKEDEAIEKLQGPTVFGRRLAEIPCFRNSFLYGISGGLATGIIYFMMSSKPGISTHIGFGSYVAITLSYWTYCRYNWQKQEKEVEQLKMYMKEYHRREGVIKKVDEELVTVSNA